MKFRQSYEGWDTRRARADAIMQTLAVGDAVLCGSVGGRWTRPTVERFTRTLAVLDDGSVWYRDGNNVGLRRGEGRSTSLLAGNDPFGLWAAAESAARYVEDDALDVARAQARAFHGAKRPMLITSYYSGRRGEGAASTFADVDAYLAEVSEHVYGLVKVVDEGRAAKAEAEKLAAARLAELEMIALPHGNPRWVRWEPQP